MGITARASPLRPSGQGGQPRRTATLPPFSLGMPPVPPRFRQTRLQQTRFQRRVAQAGERLGQWAANPWRRLSLLLVVLLTAFVVGGSLGTITGALSYTDPLAALLCVVAIEIAARGRGRLLERPGDRIGVQMLDMARMGLLYGLLIDGFKLL
jgi:hypothetical protein